MSAAAFERLLHTSGVDAGIDRKALARLLVELARSTDSNIAAQEGDGPRFDPRLEQLRTLLLGGEIQSLSRLTRQIDDPEELAKAISRILPAAIAQASARDARLGEVLAPTVERATQSSIRSDPHTLVNILYPLILPAIRKSIGETIDATFQSLNESLKHSLSWRGLQWRWQAWRTGVSFASVVLKHTLVFQVEHAFLIHRHTGLLIAHAAATDAASQDPQVVSSMLMAIQDFVRDSFTDAGQHGLDTLRLGELTLWSKPGAFATLVAVIRGNPPESLRDTLQNILTRIHAERGQALQAFDGDSSSFLDVEAQLRECVQLRQERPPSTRTHFPWPALLIGICVLGLAGWGTFTWWRDRSAWQTYLTLLRAQPGIVITESGRYDGKWQISGLRDPLAADPTRLLHGLSLNPTQVVGHWQPYQAFNAPLVLKRFAAAVRPPASIRLAVINDQAVAEGSATYAWLQRAHGYLSTLPEGSPGVDLSRIRNVNSDVLDKLRQSIQAKEILFDSNESLPAQSQNMVLDDLAAQLDELESLTSGLHVSTRVTLTGHSDATGKGTFNLSLSLARAEAVRALLKKRNVNPDLLSVRGAGPLEPLNEGASEAALSANRRVSLTISFDD